MIDNYKILTLSFSDARLDELSDYLLSHHDDRLSQATQLQNLKNELAVDELFYLNTCNRVLFLFYSQKPIEDTHLSLIKYLEKQSPHSNTRFELKEYSGEQAVRHFFEVASSLRSLVVGEQEILRQVKEAYEQSWNDGLSGDQIRILFHSTLQTAKAVHNKTRISEKTVSVVSLAMKKLRRMGIHSDDEVVLIGAGETMQKVARFLEEWKMTRVRVYNRSMDNLLLIRQILPSAEIHLLEELPNHNLNVPFIISCTGHDKYVLTPELVEESTHGLGLSECRGILDLAVPRDVHPEIITSFGLKVIEVESLRTVAEKNKQFRRKEVKLANQIVDEQINSFMEKVHRRFIEKAFQEIPAKIYATRDKAIHEVFKGQIESLDASSQDLIMEIMDYMAEKCISIPMQTARKQYMVIRNMTRPEKKKEGENPS